MPIPVFKNKRSAFTGLAARGVTSINSFNHDLPAEYSAWRKRGSAIWQARAAAGRGVTEARGMPWVVRDAVDDINRAVGRRWPGLDRLLPGRADLPEGCAAPLVAAGANGRPAGLGVCRH